MQPPIRVVQWGLGAMGSGIARLILQKPGLQLIGAIDTQPDLVGRDVGQILGLAGPLGIVVERDPALLLDPTRVDVVVLATTSWLRDLLPDLRSILAVGIDCVTIAEEMADPAAQSPSLAAEIDALARQHGVTVLGAGVNPGFVLDLLVITLSGACHYVERIEASRVNDLSPFGPTVMKSQGVGCTSDQFAAGLADGSIVGHVGFCESIHLISQALGLGVDRIEQTRAPIISSVARATPFVRVEPGMVAGCAHTGVGYRGDREVIRLIHPQQIQPQLEEQATGDYIHIYGHPDLRLSIQPEVPGGLATIALAVNMIPHVLAASPGLKRMIDLPAPAALMGVSAYRRNV